MRFILLLAILFQVKGKLSGSAGKDKHHYIQVNDSIISFFGKEPDGSPNIYYYLTLPEFTLHDFKNTYNSEHKKWD
jgi:hypothetical protein